jgi:CsoR family transcriptional regulator, copper-sensing transcriptional repressor
MSVLAQISAIQAALDKVALGPLDDHVQHCVKNAVAEDRTEEMTNEMMAAVARLMRRG